MKIAMLTFITMVAILKIISGEIIASPDDFLIECGTIDVGPMKITYTNIQNPQIASVVGNYNPDNCSFTKVDNQFILENARGSGCNVKAIGTIEPEYTMVVVISEEAQIEKESDRRFVLSCKFTSPSEAIIGTELLTNTDPNNLIFAFSQRQVVIQGEADMQYTLSIRDESTNADLTELAMGTRFNIHVQMSGTDDDEQSFKVRECSAHSGDITYTFLSDYCSTSSLITGGFFTSDLEALLPSIEAFRIIGSNVLTFDCTIDIMAKPFIGPNCVTSRRRRDVTSLNITDGTAVVQLRDSIVVFDIGSNGDQSGCIQMVTFVVPIVVLSVILIITITMMLSLVFWKRGSYKPSE